MHLILNQPIFVHMFTFMLQNTNEFRTMAAFSTIKVSISPSHLLPTGNSKQQICSNYHVVSSLEHSSTHARTHTSRTHAAFTQL